MPTYNSLKQDSNNLEREYQGASMRLSRIVTPAYDIRDGGGLPTPERVLTVGDFVVIGRVPENSVIRNLSINAREAFQTDSWIKLHASNTQSEATWELTPLVNDGDNNNVAGEINVDVDTTILLNISPSGNLTRTGTDVPVTSSGNYKTGETGVYIVAEYGGTTGTTDNKGQLEVLLDYIKSETNNGSFTGGA